MLDKLVCAKVKVSNTADIYYGRIGVIYRVAVGHCMVCFLDEDGDTRVSYLPTQLKVLDYLDSGFVRNEVVSRGVLSTLECFDRPPYRK